MKSSHSTRSRRTPRRSSGQRAGRRTRRRKNGRGIKGQESNLVAAVKIKHPDDQRERQHFEKNPDACLLGEGLGKPHRNCFQKGRILLPRSPTDQQILRIGDQRTAPACLEGPNSAIAPGLEHVRVSLGDQHCSRFVREIFSASSAAGAEGSGQTTFQARCNFSRVQMR